MTPNVCIDCTRAGCPVAGEISAYAKSCAHKPKGPRVCVAESFTPANVMPPAPAMWFFEYNDGSLEIVSSPREVRV